MSTRESASELVCMIKPRHLSADPVCIEANANQCAALAERFGLAAVHRLSARVALERDGDTLMAEGVLTAEIEQACAVTGEPFRSAIDEPVSLRFVPAKAVSSPAEGEEIEIGAEDLDEIEFEGETVNLGEAIAQSLGLAVDPYACGPNAEAARKDGLVSSEEASGPFAALAALKKI